MPQVRTCPECHTNVPDDAPQDLCPKCLLQQALSDSNVIGPGQNTPNSPIYRGRFIAPAPADLADRFPQLEILELLGQGGMGAVYKARQKKLDRLVALKIMPPEVASDPAFAERFGREARALARLNHPNIVGVHDYGQEGSLYYFIMEYVDGLNLRQLMQGKAVEPGVALQIVPQICEALQYAHDEELVHRDIKPENILIDKRGRVKIADFGLAKLVGRAPAFTLTGSQQIMGTPHYMAPEQMERPSSVDRRADIYSLGVVFYEMLTGELPLGRFAAPSQKAGVDERLDEIVLRALEREPGRRYQSISEIKTDVNSVVAGAASFPQVESAFPSKPAALDREMIRFQVMAPAAGLIFTGFVSFLSWAIVGCIVIGIHFKELAPDTPAQAFVLFVAFLAILALISGAGVLIIGGIKMMKLQSYAFATTACLWAMLPWSYAFFVGLPFGIWALLVLRRPAVKAAFLGRQLDIYAGGTPAISARTPAPGQSPGFFRSLRDFVFDSMARRESTVAAAPAPSSAIAPPLPPKPPQVPAPVTELRAWVAAQEQASPREKKSAWRRKSDQPPTRTLANLLAVGGMFGIVLLMGCLILNQDHYSLLPWIPVIPFAGFYLWQAVGGSYRGRLVVGVIGLLGTVIIMLMHRHDSGDRGHSIFSLVSAQWGVGWISLGLDIWFFSWLLGQKTGEEKAATAGDTDENSALTGLSAESKEIRRLLLSFQSQLNCYVLPEFEAGLLSVCRKVCKVPPEERILGMIDFTGNEDGDNVLLFGCQGVYFFNDRKSPEPGPHSVSYEEFTSRTFANHGKEVYLGNDQFLYTDPDAEVDCEAVTSLLNAIRQTIVTAKMKGKKKD